jgi:hypothetical protein
MTIKNRFPNQRPDFALDFNNTERIPPGVFSRASTGTYIGSDGLVKLAAINEPRFNCNPITGENSGLLVEEARTNMWNFSQDFSAANWPNVPGTTALTRTLDAIVAPDGTMTADEIKCSSSANSIFALQTNPANTVVDNNAFYTLSIFAKAGGWSRIGIRAGASALSHRTTVDLTTGTVLNRTGLVMVTPFPNDWYRIAITAKMRSTNSTLVLEVHNTVTVQTLEVGDPTNGYIYIWGAQLEKGTSASSYIPTTTTALTRAADIISINDTALPAAIADGGALFVETTNPSLSSRQAILSLSDGSAANELVVRNLPAAGGTSIENTVSGVTTSTDIIGGSSFSQNSFALRIKANDFALAGNSQPIVTASGAVPAFTQIKIGSSFTGGDGFNGAIKRLAFYSNELDNQRLEGISAKLGTVPPLTADPVFYMLVYIETPDFVWNLRSTGTVDYNVNWGDGQIELAQTSNTKAHTYALPGVYKVVVRLNSGTWRPFFNNTADGERIGAIVFTGTGWSFGTSLASAFYSASNMVLVGSIDTAAGTSFNGAWQSCNSLTSFPLINTAAGTSFASAWLNCNSLTSFPLINTAAGTNFASAWQNCSSLTSFPLINTAAGTIFSNAWTNCSSLTSFPLLDTSNGTSFNAAWQSCSSLTSFPLIDTAAGTIFSNAWFGCNSLTSFPLINTAAGTSFNGAWQSCSSLTSFPALNFDAAVGLATSVNVGFQSAWQSCTQLADFPPNLFDNTVATRYLNAFQNCALTAQSIENIIVSINTANTSNGNLSLQGGTNAGATTWTAPAITAYDALIARGWTITRNA